MNMKIIDSHIHFCDSPYFHEIAEAAGHQNSGAHLEEAFAGLDIAHGIVMGNRSLCPDDHHYPAFLSYCIGLDSDCFETDIVRAKDMVEENLKRRECVGIKLYPGYNSYYVSDPLYDDFYQLAMAYDKTVAIHTGLTAGSSARLKYSHPLTVDEVAVRYPAVRFVMCHIGNPWIVDAMAVMEKNPNVTGDLSGLLEGRLDDMEAYYNEKRGYLDYIRMWFDYLGEYGYDRLMYGTDWPLVNLAEYMTFVSRLIPERYHQRVFFDNANRVYKLGL